MRTYAALVLAIVLLAGFGLWQRGQLASFRAENAAMSDQLRDAQQARDAAIEAGRLERIRLAAARARSDALAADLETLQGMEGYDAPLSDLLRHLDGRL